MTFCTFFKKMSRSCQEAEPPPLWRNLLHIRPIWKPTHHVHSDLANVVFAILLFKVFDPVLFFGDEVSENIFQVLQEQHEGRSLRGSGPISAGANGTESWRLTVVDALAFLAATTKEAAFCATQTIRTVKSNEIRIRPHRSAEQAKTREPLKPSYVIDPSDIPGMPTTQRKTRRTGRCSHRPQLIPLFFILPLGRSMRKHGG